VSLTLFFIKAAYPAGAIAILTVPSQHGVHLVNKEQGKVSVLRIAGLPIQAKEVADSEGVSPQVTLR
jgi:hypothetical protein